MTTLIINDFNRCNFKIRGLLLGRGIMPKLVLYNHEGKYSFCQLLYHGNICAFHEILTLERQEKSLVWNKWGVGAISRLLISDQGEQTWLVWVRAKAVLLGIILHKIKNIYSWVNLVVPKSWVAYFSAISGRKFDLTTVLRSCWPKEWRRRGLIASGPFLAPQVL